MRCRFITVIIVVFIHFLTFAQVQDARLPYLKGDLYGICDENGVLIIETKFDDVVVDYDNRIIALLQKDLWGVYNFEGDRILDHIIKNNDRNPQNSYGISDPYSALFGFRNPKSNFKTSNLIGIVDNYANVIYYLNRYLPIPNPVPYNLPRTRPTKARRTHVSTNQSHVRVVTRSKQVNIIDTLGREIFSNAFQDGFELGNGLLAISNGKNYALYKNSKALSKFIFNSFELLNEHGVISCSVVEIDSNNVKNYFYLALNSKGEFASDTFTNLFNIDPFILGVKDSGYVLLDQAGNLERTSENLNVQIRIIGSKKYLLFRKNDEYFIEDIYGTILTGVGALGIRIQGDLICKRMEDGLVVLDSNFQELFTLESALGLEFMNGYKNGKRQRLPFYSVSVKNEQSYSNRFGLCDFEGNYILEPVAKSKIIFSCDSLAVIRTDSSKILYNLYSKKTLARDLPDRDISVSCDANEYFFLTSRDSFERYSFEGELLEKDRTQFTKEQARMKEQTLYESKNISGQYYLVDKNNNTLTSGYKYIRRILLDQTFLYFCEMDIQKFPNVKILDKDLNELNFPEYGMASNWTRTLNENPGQIFVANIEDVNKDRYSFRSGVIDYKGNWVIEPFLGTFRYIERDLYIMINQEEEALKFYNAKGELVSDDRYDIVQDKNGSSFFHGRIMVGKFKDPNYKQKAKKLLEDISDYRKAFEKLKEEGEPEINYGFVSSKGEVIVPLIYTKAQPFSLNDTTTFVTQRLANGNLISHVIDIHGNITFSAPYDELKKASDTHYQGELNGKFALLGSNGKAKTPHMFESIYEIRGVDNVFMAGDSTARFLIDDAYRIQSIGNADRFNCDKINNDHFHVKMSNEVEKYRYKDTHVVYNNSLEKVYETESTVTFSENFNGKLLPKNFIAIEERYRKTIVLNTRSKKVFTD